MARLDVVGIVVADMAASLAFYRLLGLAVPEGAADEGHVEVPLGGGMRLLLDTHDTMRSFDSGFRPPGAGAMSLAFRCSAPAEVDRLHADLVAAGHRSRHEPWDAFWGQRYATVLDPDDNPVDLYAPLEPAS